MSNSRADEREYGKVFLELISTVSEPVRFVNSIADIIGGSEGREILLWASKRSKEEIAEAVRDALSNQRSKDEWEFLYWINTNWRDERDIPEHVEALEDHKPSEGSKGTRIIGGPQIRAFTKTWDLIFSSLITKQKRTIVISGERKSGKSLFLKHVEECIRLSGMASLVDFREATADIGLNTEDTVVVLDDADCNLTPQDRSAMESFLNGTRARVVVFTCENPADFMRYIKDQNNYIQIPPLSQRDGAMVLYSHNMASKKLSFGTCQKIMRLIHAISNECHLAKAFLSMENLIYRAAIGELLPTVDQSGSLCFSDTDIYECVRNATGTNICVPSGNIQDMVSRKIRKRIKGQDHIISQIAPFLVPVLTATTDPTRPASVFLFYGPTGTGKTELARTIADVLYNGKFHKEDMNTYIERHSAYSIIGSPPGYVGFDKTPPLMTFIDTVKRGVILFDEIEKAHPDLIDFIMEILETGIARDAKGILHDARGFIIIMTSNITLSSGHKSAGFISNIEVPQTQKALTEVAATRMFKPEFLGRIDLIAKFNELDQHAVKAIARKLIADLRKQLSDRGIPSTAKTEYITKTVNAYIPASGARSMKRFVNSAIKSEIIQEAHSSGNTREKTQI